MSYIIRTKDIYLKETMQKNITSVFAPFVSDGKIKIKKSEKYKRAAFNQAINLFHIPTKANFSK
jgi:hypothetical protein